MKGYRDVGSESQSGSIAEAAGHGDLGLTTGFKGRLRLPRRILTRILSPLLREQITFNHQLLAILNAFSQRIEFFDRAYENFENAFDNVEQAILDAHKREVLLSERLELIQRQGFVRYQQAVGSLQSDVANAEQRFGQETSEIRDSLRALSAELKDSKADLKDSKADIDRSLAGARMRLGELDLFLNEVKRSLPGPPTREQLAALPSAFSALYPAFEEVLRGPESLIRERARGYLRDVEGVAHLGAVLDLGCGRCEWLSVLHESGLDSYGVDTNEQFVKNGLERGFDVRLSDAIEHLKSLPEGKLAAITAFHLVEHIGTDSLIELLDLSVRALQPGGLLILETPDPENLFVGASSFYLDPTHLHPIPPQLLEFLVRSRGFNDVQIRELKREQVEEFSLDPNVPWSDDVMRIWEFVATRINGPEDYAVLARRV
jgi:SAM-dependent methyltransferase